MMFRLGKESRAKLVGVHPDLILVVGRAISISEVDFGIAQGRRSIEEQRKLLEAGKSKTMNSRHLTGHAIDVIPADGWPESDASAQKIAERISEFFKRASLELAIPITWGGDFPKIYTTKFKDGPHYELLWAAYPATPDDVPPPVRIT